jgi:hypothetical protein
MQSALVLTWKIFAVSVTVALPEYPLSVNLCFKWNIMNQKTMNNIFPIVTPLIITTV